jgi:hypothetical protein
LAQTRWLVGANIWGGIRRGGAVLLHTYTRDVQTCTLYPIRPARSQV